MDWKKLIRFGIGPIVPRDFLSRPVRFAKPLHLYACVRQGHLFMVHVHTKSVGLLTFYLSMFIFARLDFSRSQPVGIYFLRAKVGLKTGSESPQFVW